MFGIDIFFWGTVVGLTLDFINSQLEGWAIPNKEAQRLHEFFEGGGGVRVMEVPIQTYYEIAYPEDTVQLAFPAELTELYNDMPVEYRALVVRNARQHFQEMQQHARRTA